LELVEMEIRDLLSFYEYDGWSCCSRFCFRWIEYDPVWVPKILELMEADAVD
jgi:translation elongation factor EF-Tu-like GTPase